MRRLSQLALVLDLAALAVCIGIAFNRAGRADRGGPVAPTTAEPNHLGTTAGAAMFYTPDAEQAANLKRDQIRAEVEKLGAHPWAGEYYAGDGLGVNTVVLLAPKAGYVFEWHGCLGLYDRNYGPVAEKDGKLSLSFTFENSREGFHGIAPELVPVSWGAR